MKWVFRGIIAILFGFVLCCVAGFFMPAAQVVETHISVESYPDEIYTELSDLRGYPAWFHGQSEVDAGQIVYAGAESGIGQSAAWQLDGENVQFGNLEILQAQTDNFVTLQHEQGAQIISLTYAVQQELDGSNTDGAVLLLARYETQLGGFPYLSRLRAALTQGRITADLDTSLRRLQSLIEPTTVP